MTKLICHSVFFHHALYSGLHLQHAYFFLHTICQVTVLCLPHFTFKSNWYQLLFSGGCILVRLICWLYRIFNNFIDESMSLRELYLVVSDYFLYLCYGVLLQLVAWGGLQPDLDKSEYSSYCKFLTPVKSPLFVVFELPTQQLVH